MYDKSSEQWLAVEMHTNCYIWYLIPKDSSMENSYKTNNSRNARDAKKMLTVHQEWTSMLKELISKTKVNAVDRKVIRKHMRWFKKPNVVYSKTHVATQNKSFIHTPYAKNDPNKIICGKEPILFRMYLKSTSSLGSQETSIVKKGPLIARNCWKK